MITYVKGVHEILSNFSQAPLFFNGDTFKSAEHIYQSRKAIFHDLLEIDDLIRLAPDAKEAKKLPKHSNQATVGRSKTHHNGRNS